MSSGWIGRRVARKEDHRFLTGRGRFTDDLVEPGAVRAIVVRSPHPHARILDVGASQARAMNGVLAVLTGRDVEGKIGPIPTLARTPPFARLNRDGSPMPDPCQPALATTKTRYAGEPVAMVVAETETQALDAAEAVVAEYEPLPAVTTYEQARAPETPVWEDNPRNVTFDRDQGDREATDAAFAAAAHVVEGTLANNRVAPVFLEPRSAVASHDAGTETWTLTLGCQTAHGMRGILAGMLGIEPERLHVVVPDMGGGFGARGTPYPESSAFDGATTTPALTSIAAWRSQSCGSSRVPHTDATTAGPPPLHPGPRRRPAERGRGAHRARARHRAAPPRRPARRGLRAASRCEGRDRSSGAAGRRCTRRPRGRSRYAERSRRSVRVNWYSRRHPDPPPQAPNTPPPSGFPRRTARAARDAPAPAALPRAAPLRRHRTPGRLSIQWRARPHP